MCNRYFRRTYPRCRRETMRDWGEPNAMSNATESGAAESVPNSQRWIFAEDYLSSTPSIRDGIPPEKELKYRQQAARCIITMGERLNSNVASGKMSQLCFYAAMMHMHRFFVFHSFRRFDYTDVAAACLFLAGKSEECPRKLEHIVRVWWGLKFPKHPYIDKNHRHYPEASQLIVFLENVVLQTIAFDLQIEVPHTIILHSMQHVRVDKRYIETMYFFATDLPCVTNFGVRYTASALACLCIQIVCLWAQYEIPSQDNQPWYLKIDPKMTEEKLQKMQDEFLDVYASVKDTHVLSFHRFAEKNGMDFRGRPRPVKQETPTSLGIPPPPAPPTMPGSSKKVELSEYKVRKHADARSNAPSTLPAPADRIPKRSFIPDTSQLKNATTELVLPPNVAALSNSMAKPTEQSGVPRPRDDDVRRRMAEKDRERGARHSDPAGIRKRSRERDASPHHVHHADNKRIRTEGLPSSSQPRPTHVQHNFAHIPHSHTKPHSGSNGSNNHVQRLPIHSTAAVNMMRAPSDILTPPRHPSSIRGSQLKAMSPVLPPPPRPPVKQELEDGEVE